MSKAFFVAISALLTGAIAPAFAQTITPQLNKISGHEQIISNNGVSGYAGSTSNAPAIGRTSGENLTLQQGPNAGMNIVIIQTIIPGSP